MFDYMIIRTIDKKFKDVLKKNVLSSLLKVFLEKY